VPEKRQEKLQFLQPEKTGYEEDLVRCKPKPQMNRMTGQRQGIQL
jgi:hypothetical protein